MHNEFKLMQEIRLEASKLGIYLWRNNVGACCDERGHFIRYGLANDSKQINAVLKSSDLIGIQPILITQDMVGELLGRFICREIKQPRWRFNSNNKRDIAQKNWIDLVNANGGDACFVTDIGSFK